MYFVRTPQIIQTLFPKIIWSKPNSQNQVFLTFDDGPHPEITPWILDVLKHNNAKVTFFCLGENVLKYPEITEQIIKDGHTLGNHGFEHIDGWKQSAEKYFENYIQGKKILEDITQGEVTLFRPAYGKFRLCKELSVVMWSLMPGDFDLSVSDEICYKRLLNANDGDIIVLHDNEKSFAHLKYSLPLFLQEKKDFHFTAL